MVDVELGEVRVQGIGAGPNECALLPWVIAVDDRFRVSQVFDDN